jgi:hypothetical protein
MVAGAAAAAEIGAACPDIGARPVFDSEVPRPHLERAQKDRDFRPVRSKN